MSKDTEKFGILVSKDTEKFGILVSKDTEMWARATHLGSSSFGLKFDCGEVALKAPSRGFCFSLPAELNGAAA